MFIYLDKGYARTSCFITLKLTLLPLTLGERHSLETGSKRERMMVQMHRFREDKRNSRVSVSSLSPGVGEIAARLSLSQTPGPAGEAYCVADAQE